AAGEEEIAGEEREKAAPSAPTPRKRKRKRAATTIDGGASVARICDDVAVNILARLPARAAVACTALSKHHGGLIRSPRPEQENPVSVFHGFHVAGAGLISGDAPMRALTGWRHLGTQYVGTCNGVVLLASEEFAAPCRCTLWNPAVADAAREVTVPESECLVLGLGYGRRSKTYKLLLFRKDAHRTDEYVRGGGRTHRFEYSLAVRSLGDADKQTPPRTVLSAGVDEGIKEKKSIYMDGAIYLLHFGLGESATTILAFDVDDETVSRLDMPRGRRQDGSKLGSWELELIEMSADRRWERVCVIPTQDSAVYFDRIIGVWDCGGVLVLCFEFSEIDSDCKGKVWLYDVATKKLFRADMPGDLTVTSLGCYEISWGYKPTLVSPGSIVGEFDQDLEVERRRNRSAPAHITGAINPLGPLDRRRGQEATLNTVCLMEFLIRIMQ
ncbi:hypothetical protein PVAP13_7NG315948, partial [Panicum virgatum]